jgi:hypothetical protein
LSLAIGLPEENDRNKDKSKGYVEHIDSLKVTSWKFKRLNCRLSTVSQFYSFLYAGQTTT